VLDDSFLQLWNSASQDQILLLVDNNFDPIVDEIDMERVEDVFKNDEQVAFIMTDFKVGLATEFLNNGSISNVPFFAKKKIEIDNLIPDQNILSNIMHKILSRGFLFEHIADAYFRQKV